MAGSKPDSRTITHPERRGTTPKRQRKSSGLICMQPQSLDELMAILADSKACPSPVRPVGSGSCGTRANRTVSGTEIDMTALDRILAVTATTVQVEAGITLRVLAEHLAAEGLELVGGCGELQRTLGGAVSSSTLGGALPDSVGQLAATVEQLTLITGRGRRVEVSQKLPELLRLVRMSYGLLGVVYAVTLQIRPVRAYTISASKLSLPEFAESIPALTGINAAVRAVLLPFRNRAYLELRCPDEGELHTTALPWKLRDWAQHAALPTMVRSVNRVLPVQSLRDPLIDHVTQATQAFVTTGISGSGSNAVEQSGRFRKLVLADDLVNCVWFFPAQKFAAVLAALPSFCTSHYRQQRFRCDLPAEVWRIDADDTSLLSPAFAGPVFALNLRATRRDGWEDFLLELAEFAAHFAGIPVFNQTRGCSAPQVRHSYGRRLNHFRAMRQKLDPDNRFLNQYFAEYIG